MTCYETGPYACRTGETPKPVVWPYACQPYYVNEIGTSNADTPAGLSDDLLDAVKLSFEEWNQVGCSRMQMNFGGRTDVTEARFNQGPGAQNLNLVVWREENWNQVASNSTFALTSVSYNPNTGEIADADIEINAEIYTISVVDPVEANAVDLRNTLVHEIGHFIGLDHTPVEEATMYRSADIGETEKRTLHQDDIDGICHIYPASEIGASACDEPPEDVRCVNCDDDDNGGCCATTPAPAPTGLAWLIGAGGLLLAAGWRRRRF
ncbi:matrixin family metalloprotease [Persicimonas caeni]|uniref:Matrixin family metalloprotease n=1 Tax=Persicimonas caeni TaxID=2292766 RepID=A0A4Y6PXR9_PERCE|nr:matrixin family metalloprotease [Persicimonas caeni]QDG53030.1 matrixin family metalloprotease [Persicimonas caeni]QED34252.1 matrixin family metalloprotease [Persicimonas caeni]